MLKILLKSTYDALVGKECTQRLLKEKYRRLWMEERRSRLARIVEVDRLAKDLKRTENLLTREEETNQELSEACARLSKSAETKNPDHVCKAREDWFNPNFAAPCQECGKIIE